MDERLQHYVFMFVDVVRYSTLSQEGQLDVGAKLSRVISRTLLGEQLKTPANGVFLSTGDGFALGFLNHLLQSRPKYLVDLALEIQEKMAPLRLRIGLHAGTAQPYADFNAQFYQDSTVRNNIAGTGINVAQRVMNLGDADDILCSSDFFDLCHGADPAGADDSFCYLGRIRVKHGLELDIFKVGDGGPPTRIRNYTHAQSAVKSLLRHICEKAPEAAHPSARNSLRPRASVLAYDPAGQNLYVTTFRVGAGLGDPPQRSKAKFALDEGPGRTFLQAREGNAQVHHIELPDAASVGVDEYVRVFNEKTGIPERAIAGFSKKARLYVYFPILQGTDRRNVLGVLSLDCEGPLFDKDDLRRQMRRQKGGRAGDQDIESRVERGARKYRERLNQELQGLLRQLSEAWALLIHY